MRFSSVLGVSRNNIARLNPDGTLDTAFNPNANNQIRSIALQSDGKILVGGEFSGANSIGGQSRNYIARLDATTGLADSFDPNADSNVASIAVQTDGKILVAGNFWDHGTGAITIGGQSRNYVARLDPVSGLADSFDPHVNRCFGTCIDGVVLTMLPEPDGKILIGGLFNKVGGQDRNNIARLDSTTGIPDSFDPNPTGDPGGFFVESIALQPDGKILVGGGFTRIGGQARNRIARLDATTGLADSFNPNANGDVVSIALQADGMILVGGFFNSIGGVTRNFIARLNPTTGLADSFNPNAATNGIVEAIAIPLDGKVLVGGYFFGANGIGGQPRNGFARLSNDTAALQNLAVMQTSVIWTLGGSSPQFTRVIFESSPDNVSYTSLGTGTASGSNWTLTGLSLPAAQSIYIRARGHYRAGYENASDSIMESVRNAVPGTLQLTAAVSRKTHGGAGNFDIPLPLVGGVGVECRSTGGVYKLVFTFSNNMVSGNASVTTGTGSVAGSPIFANNTMTVNLTGVADVQRITVTLSNVTDTFAQALPDTAVSVNMLIGDTSGNKAVNASDVSQTKLQSGQAVTATNFREDVNVNGSINATDVSLVKLKSGTALP